MDANGFMAEVERDAARRAKEREQRVRVAANMRKYAVVWLLQIYRFCMDQKLLPFQIREWCIP